MSTNETKYISSNQSYACSGLWHVGVRHELCGEKTGKIFSIYYVTKCNGRQLGGSWGYKTADELPEGSEKCPRCFKEAQRIGKKSDSFTKVLFRPADNISMSKTLTKQDKVEAEFEYRGHQVRIIEKTYIGRTPVYRIYVDGKFAAKSVAFDLIGHAKQLIDAR